MKTIALTEETTPRRTHSRVRSVVSRSRPQSSALMTRSPRCGNSPLQGDEKTVLFLEGRGFVSAGAESSLLVVTLEKYEAHGFTRFDSVSMLTPFRLSDLRARSKPCPAVSPCHILGWRNLPAGSDCAIRVAFLPDKQTSGEEVPKTLHLLAPPERHHLARDGPLLAAHQRPEVAGS